MNLSIEKVRTQKDAFKFMTHEFEKRLDQFEVQRKAPRFDSALKKQSKTQISEAIASLDNSLARIRECANSFHTFTGSHHRRFRRLEYRAEQMKKILKAALEQNNA